MERKILVLGIGNLLMGDEGAGVRVAETLLATVLPSHVEVVEGGTGGFHLLELFDHYEQVIIVDAALDSKPPGTISVLTPRYASDFPPTLTAHDIGLKDLVDAAHLLGHAPPIQLVTISVNNFQSMGLELSKQVAAAIPLAVNKVLRIVEDLVSVPAGDQAMAPGKEIGHA